MFRTRFTMLIIAAFVLFLPVFVWADLTDGLVAYYPFNGNANDESGNGNHGVVYGATLTEDRQVQSNRAYHFDGYTNYIAVQDSESLHIPGQITMAAWIYIDSYTSDWSPILCKGYAEDSYRLNVYQGKLAIQIGYQTHGSIDIPQNQWVHVAATWDGYTLRFYVNGVQDPVSFGFIWNNNNDELFIGMDPPGLTEYMHGKIDEVRIYNRALSDAEIQELYIGKMYSYPVDGIEYVTCPVDSGTAYDPNNPSTWYTMVWTGKYTGNAQDRCEGSGGHPGVDIVPRTQEAYNIKAIGDATVIERIYLNDWGNCIILEHNNDPTYGTFYSIYAHLASIDSSVQEGQPVKRGQKIGTMGCTGSACQGTHLHFQLDKYLFPVTNKKGDILYYKPYWPTYTKYTKDWKNWSPKSYPANDSKLTIEELLEVSENVMFYTINPIWFIEQH